MNGKYIEPLSSGGDLVVTAEEWYIKYYFLGPDFRHNGEIKTVEAKDVKQYIDAFKKNFDKYQTLLQVIPSNGEFQTKGECNMNIGIGKYREGVTISQWYNHLSGSCFPIDNQEKLDKVILDYIYCEERAEEIKKKLFE